MSEEQLSALFARLKKDVDLRGKFQAAADLDAAVAIAKEAGFDVSEEDWRKNQSKRPFDLSDEDLEVMAGGKDQPDCRCTQKWAARVFGTGGRGVYD